MLYATGPFGLCKWQGAQGQHALCKKEEQSRMQPTQKPMVHTHLDPHFGAVCRRLPRYVDEQATGTHVGRCRCSKRDRSLHGTTMVEPCGQRKGRTKQGAASSCHLASQTAAQPRVKQDQGISKLTMGSMLDGLYGHNCDSAHKGRVSSGRCCEMSPYQYGACGSAAAHIRATRTRKP